MTVSHLSQLRQLQEEDAKLKRMYAGQALMHHALKDVVDRNSPPGQTQRQDTALACVLRTAPEPAAAWQETASGTHQAAAGGHRPAQPELDW